MRQRSKQNPEHGTPGTGHRTPAAGHQAQDASPWPLSEGLRTGRRPFGSYLLMGNGELMMHAIRLIDEGGIRTRAGLKRADPALYRALHWRERGEPGLLDKTCLAKQHEPVPKPPSKEIHGERRYRRWARMNSEEFIRQARCIIIETGIGSRKGLSLADKGLYEALLKREKDDPGLAEKIGLSDRACEMVGWKSMGDERIVEHALSFVEETGASGRRMLRKLDGRLYKVLKRRGLTGRIFPETEHVRRATRAVDILGRIKEALREYWGDGK